MEDLAFTFNAVAPVFLVVFVGTLLKRIGTVSTDFVDRSSSLVFHVGLPSMLFVKTAAITTDPRALGLPVALMAAASLLVCVAGWMLCRPLTGNTTDRGVFAQGVFRSNMAIIGLPILAGIPGEHIMAQAILIIAVMMPLYNVLAVTVLTATTRTSPHSSLVRASLRPIATNPLILAVVLGSIPALFRISLPPFISLTGTYLGQMTFPLALIGIGATLDRRSLRRNTGAVLWAAFIKTMVFPCLVCLPAWFLGAGPQTITVLLILSGTPAAVSSFIMARAMHADDELAAGIVFLSTLFSLFTLSGGIYLLRSLAVI